MTTWRMAFRCGSRGHEMWPECFELGVAAITYWQVAETDLSGLSPEEFKDACAGLASNPKANLRKVAYEMRKGDVIYVKQGPRIVYRGRIKGPYRFGEFWGSSGGRIRSVTPRYFW